MYECQSQKQAIVENHKQRFNVSLQNYHLVFFATNHFKKKSLATNGCVSDKHEVIFYRISSAEL